MQERYLGYNGQELFTRNGEVITVADVAAEQVFHSDGLTMDKNGRVIFLTQGNYKLAVDAGNPNKSEWYATKDGTVDGQRKINSVHMYEHTDPSKSQIVFNEEGYNHETGKSGQVKPMIYVDKDTNSTYVSTQTVNRFGNPVVEADRRDYNRPVDDLARMKDESKYKVIKLTEQELGLDMSNDARVQAPGGRLALLSREATLILGGSEKPVIENGVWQPYEKFITENMEGMGHDTVATVRELYNLPVNQELLETYKAKLADYVQEQLKKEIAK